MRWQTAISIVVFVSVLGACGSSGGPCTNHTGTYSVTFSRRDGNCGDIPEQVIVISGPSAVPQGCTGSVRTSADGCDVTYDVTCPVKGGTLTERGSGSWSNDGSSGHATEQVILNASVSCSGTYDVTYRKLR